MQRLARMRRLPPKGTGLLTGRAGPRRFGKPRTYMQRLSRHPGARALSDSLSFSIAPYLAANGIVYAIRVKDIERFAPTEYCNWDLGVGWTGKPLEVKPGPNNLYIAFYVVNQGDAGNLTITIKDDTGATLAAKVDYVPAGGSIGDECTVDMPSRSYGLTLIVTP